MKRSLTVSYLRGAAPSSSLASIGWARHDATHGLVRKATAVLPRRDADFLHEPSWKLYDRGDPALFENWHGKMPNGLPEDADLIPISPQDQPMYVDMIKEYGTPLQLTLKMLMFLSPFAVLTGICYYISEWRKRTVRSIQMDYRTLPPETIRDMVLVYPNLPEEWHNKVKERGLIA